MVANGDDILIRGRLVRRFCPSDKPQLAICVNVLDASGDGGTVAPPIAAAILSDGLVLSRRGDPARSRFVPHTGTNRAPRRLRPQTGHSTPPAPDRPPVVGFPHLP